MTAANVTCKEGIVLITIGDSGVRIAMTTQVARTLAVDLSKAVHKGRNQIALSIDQLERDANAGQRS